MNPKAYQSRRGSIYVITLVSVAAIVSMVYVGMSVRSSNSTKSELIAQMSLGSHDAINGTEYAIERIINDSQWMTNAQKGIVFAPVTIGGSTISSKVVDAVTGELPTARTSTYRVIVTSQQETAKFAASIDIMGSNVDYAAYVESLDAWHYWPLNDVSKSTIADDAVWHYDGTYLDPSVAGAGTNDDGGVVPVFANASDSVSVPWGSNFFVDNGTFSMWVNCTGENRLTEYAFLGMLFSEGGVPAVNLSILGNGVWADVNSSGSARLESSLVFTGYDTITPKSWHHIALTWGAAGVVVYIDGVKSASDPSNTDILTTAKGRSGKQPLHIGSGYNMFTLTDSSPAIGFEGSVAHVAYFGTQLTADQIADLAAIRPDLQEFVIVEDSWARVAD